MITTRTADGPAGMTASAVASLSMDPLQLLVCIGTKLPTCQAIVESGHFAVNVLGEGQQHLATRFATRRRDKFAGVTLRADSDIPVLVDAIAHFVCAVGGTLPGGDHTIVVGSVLSLRSRPRHEPAGVLRELVRQPLRPGRPRQGRLRLAVRVGDVTARRAQSAVVVRTRLRPPVAHPDDVRRSRLLARLDAVREPVIVVAAPRGAGKTVLLAQWVTPRADRGRCAWVSLSGHDDSPAGVWSAILESVRPYCAGVPVAPAALLDDETTLFTEIIPELLNALASAGPLVLVLDRLDAIDHPTTRATLYEFVRRIPDSHPGRAVDGPAAERSCRRPARGRAAGRVRRGRPPARPGRDPAAPRHRGPSPRRCDRGVSGAG